MPSYDYKCKGCGSNVTLERSMTDESQPVCTECGSDDMSRVWSVFVIGGSSPAAGQGALPAKSAPRKSGCGSCSSHSCGSCH